MTSSRSRLDVLYVGTLPPHPGGSAILAGQILHGLSGRGHKVRAIAPIPEGVLPTGEPRGVEIIRFTQPRFEVSPDKPVAEETREEEGRRIGEIFPRLVRARRPDVVIVGREMFAWHVPRLSAALGLPTVQWVQGATLWGMRNGSLPMHTVRTLVSRMGLASRTVAVAKHVVDPLLELGLVATDVVPNGVDLKAFQPRPAQTRLRWEMEIPEGNKVLLHASNLKEIKRPLDLISAAEIVTNTYTEMVWIILGDGPCRQEMEEACRARGLSTYFRFVDWVPHGDMPRWMNLSDLVSMPSAAEAMALVYLEAMASGAVLIASDIAATREIIEDGKTGLLHPVGDPSSLARQILRVVSDPELAMRIRRNAVRSVGAYDLNLAVEGHLKILMELKEGRPS